MSDTQKCSKCNDVKGLIDFQKKGKNEDGQQLYEKKCKICRKPEIQAATLRAKVKREADSELLARYQERQKAFKQGEKCKATTKKYVARPATRAREAADLNRLIIACLHRDKNKGRVSSIDRAWLDAELNKQGCKCHYCDSSLSLQLKDRTLDQISIDRKDNSVGYLKNNCIVSCLFCNYCRNDTEYDLFLHLITSFKTGEIAPELSTHPSIPIVPSKLRCSLACDDRNKGRSNTCRLSDVKKLLQDQNYKCAITGFPLINSPTPRFPLKPSIDRIDSAGDHSLDNCQIIIMAVNLGKNNREDKAVRAYLKDMRDAYASHDREAIGLNRMGLFL